MADAISIAVSALTYSMVLADGAARAAQALRVALAATDDSVDNAIPAATYAISVLIHALGRHCESAAVAKQVAGLWATSPSMTSTVCRLQLQAPSRCWSMRWTATRSLQLS